MKIIKALVEAGRAFTKAIRLEVGSHDDFTEGPCVMEAAIVAAGFQHRSVGSAADMPPCFDKPLSEFLIQLNDNVSPLTRQKLAPVICLMAGSSTTAAKSKARMRRVIDAAWKVLEPIALKQEADSRDGDDSEGTSELREAFKEEDHDFTDFENITCAIGSDVPFKVQDACVEAIVAQIGKELEAPGKKEIDLMARRLSWAQDA